MATSNMVRKVSFLFLIYDESSSVCIKVYKSGYFDLVSKQVEDSLNAAVNEVEALPHFLTDGEVQ